MADGALPPQVEGWLRQQQQKHEGVPGLSARSSWQVATPRGILFIRRVAGSHGENHLVLSEQRIDSSAHDLVSLGLSPREAEVLHWIAQGKTNEAIATILSASKRTVDKHVENILRKLGVESRVGAALRADQHYRLS